MDFKRITLAFCGLILSIQAYCHLPLSDVQKLNNMLIFDVFMNFELSEKNGNLATLIDFIPNVNNVNYTSIQLTTNVGGRKDQVLNFYFSPTGSISNMDYEVNNKIYRYEFVYEGNQLKTVMIADKPKISFSYDKRGRLQTITRLWSGGAVEFNFEYLEGINKANIKLVVVQDEKRSPSSQKYYVSWNSGFKPDSYCIDVYCSKNIKYNPHGDILSYSFSNVERDNNIASWEYSAVDGKQNWTERKSKETIFNRSIVYK